MTWAVKYRPQDFKSLVGQRINAVVLSQMVKSDSTPTGLLFTGASGTGKTTLARVFATAVTASEVIEVDAATHGGVAEIRNLLSTLSYSTGGGRRILVLDEAHNLSSEAFNALLKSLEEPPTNTTFILVTTEAYKIPDTILSRLMEFHFAPVSVAALQARLEFICGEEESTLSKDVIHEIAVRAQGNVRKAIMEAEQASIARIRTLDQFMSLRGDRNLSVEVLKGMVANDPVAVFAIVDPYLDASPEPYKILADLTESLKDVLLAQAGDALNNHKSRSDLIDLGHKLSQGKVLTALKILWECQTSLKKSEVPRMNVYLVLTLMLGVLSVKSTPKVVPQPTKVEAKPMSMEELRADDL